MIGLLALALASLQTMGPSRCPSPAAVSAALDELLSESQRQVNHLALMTALDGELHLWIYDTEAQLLAERTLPARGDCARQATELAAVVAAVETQLQGPTLREAAPPARADPALGIEPTPEPRRRAPVVSVASAAATSPPAAPAPSAAPWRCALEVGVGAELSSDIVPALSLGLRARPEGSPFGLQLFAFGDLAHSAAFGGGTFHWLLPALGTGPSAEMRLGPARLQLQVNGIAALFVWRAEGFAQDGASVSPTFGVAAAVRARWPLGRWEPWAQLASTGWITRNRLIVPELQSGYDVPSWTLALTLGTSVGP